MAYNQVMGAYGENLAKEYLQRQGYHIMAANLRFTHKEIDLLAQKGEQLCFIEVKTRTTDQFGPADDQMSFSKIRTLQWAMQSYCREHNICLDDVQLDLIAINIDKLRKKAKISHYKAVV